MAGLQFSQYQRLESGDRFFSGCSMRVGLSVCAVLMLDPYDFFRIDVRQPDPATLKPHEPFDVDIPEDLFKRRKVGRKPIRRDVMSIYVNHWAYSMIIPRNVLEALGKPAYIQFRWNREEKRLLFHGVDADADMAIDIPSHMYDRCTGLVFPPFEIITEVKEALGWDDDSYAVECRLVSDPDENRYILCDLNKAQPSDYIDGPFAIPACLDIDDEE